MAPDQALHPTAAGRQNDGGAALLELAAFKIGLILLVLGTGPLLLIIVLAASEGSWPDPNPNPIGSGLLVFFTFWPSVICIAVGATRARSRALEKERSHRVS